MVDLEDRVAVVTGAASGIGYALVERFLTEGARVSMADVDGPRLAAAASALRAGGHTVLDVVTDVGDPAAVDELAARTMETFGRVDVLCNNAGSISFGAVWDIGLEEWERMISVNLRSVVHGIRAFVPHLRWSGDDGHIVNTASMAPFLDLGMVAPYATTKHAVVGLSLVLAQDLALHESGIGVSVLCPGMVATRLLEPDTEVPPDDELPDGILAASEVAAMVLEAIDERRFWIFTDQDDSRHQVRRRFDSILGGFG